MLIYRKWIAYCDKIMKVYLDDFVHLAGFCGFVMILQYDISVVCIIIHIYPFLIFQGQKFNLDDAYT